MEFQLGRRQYFGEGGKEDKKFLQDLSGKKGDLGVRAGSTPRVARL